MIYLLDTHTWVWWNAEPAKLSRRVRSIIQSIAEPDELVLSAISLWELCKLIEKGRLGVATEPEAWIDQALQMRRMRLAPLTPRVAYRSTTLPPPFHDDPADQMIVATAREENATVLSMDRRIRDYPHVTSVW